MQYGAIPTNLLERVALMSGKVPVPMMDALFSIMKARGLMAAVHLGIFEAVRDRPRTAAEIASALKLDEPALISLLRCLVWAGYLRSRNARYALSKLSRNTMIEGAAMQLTGFLEWNYTQWKMVEGLEDTLRTGRGANFHRTMSDPGEWAWYQQAMLEVARFDAPAVVKNVPVKTGARKLLDVAGSHGLLGAAICRKHPPMRSVVIDLPSALPAARALAKKEGIEDVVEHRSGDICEIDFDKDYDVALLANIVHHFLPDTNIAILKRVRAALTDKGTAAIWEIETPDPKSSPSEGDGAALYFRLTSTASCYSGNEYAHWMKEAGFADVRIIRPALSPGSVLTTARKRQ